MKKIGEEKKDQPIKPIEPIGFVRRKTLNKLNILDKQYLADLEKYKEEHTNWLYPNYQSMVDEYNGNDYVKKGISLEQFVADYDKYSFLFSLSDISVDCIIQKVLSIYKSKIKGEYIESEETTNFIEFLAHHFINTDSYADFSKYTFVKQEIVFNDKNIITEYSKDKDLLICGKTGVGKSKIIESFVYLLNNSSEIIEDINGKKAKISNFTINKFNNVPREMYLAREIQRMQVDNPSAYNQLLHKDNIVVDDVFAEDKNYAVEPLIGFFEIRYNLGLKTMLIANYFDKDYKVESVIMELIKKYKGRVFSRFFENYIPVELKDNDKRIIIKK